MKNQKGFFIIPVTLIAALITWLSVMIAVREVTCKKGNCVAGKLETK